jgi:hypothetical protein
MMYSDSVRGVTQLAWESLYGFARHDSIVVGEVASVRATGAESQERFQRFLLKNPHMMRGA